MPKLTSSRRDREFLIEPLYEAKGKDSTLFRVFHVQQARYTLIVRVFSIFLFVRAMLANKICFCSMIYLRINNVEVFFFMLNATWISRSAVYNRRRDAETRARALPTPKVNTILQIIGKISGNSRNKKSIRRTMSPDMNANSKIKEMYAGQLACKCVRRNFNSRAA